MKLLEWVESKLCEEDRGYETLCLIWQGASGGNGGYGVATYVVNGKRTTRAAHVLYYELHNGPVPEGLELDHLCKVRMCVRHTEVVTQEENNRRKRRSICKNGHEMTEENIYYHPVTRVIHGCKECRREAVRRSRTRR